MLAHYIEIIACVLFLAVGLARNSCGPTKGRGMGGARERRQSEVTCFHGFLLFFGTCTNCICLALAKACSQSRLLALLFITLGLVISFLN